MLSGDRPATFARRRASVSSVWIRASCESIQLRYRSFGGYKDSGPPRDRRSGAKCGDAFQRDHRSARSFRTGGGRHALSVGAAELLADRSELPLFKFADGDPAPPLGGTDDGGVHQLQHRALTKRVRDDLRTPALFEEQSLEQIRGTHDAAMPEREAQVGDARVEVVTETLHHRWQLPLVRLDEVIAQHRGEGPRRRLVTAARPQRDLRPPALGALLRRLRSRCTRQRWRSARGKHVSTARISPGAPSVTTSSGSVNPRRLRSSKKAVQLAVSSFVPGARCSGTFWPSSVVPQAQSTLPAAGRHAAAPPPRRRTGRRPRIG